MLRKLPNDFSRILIIIIIFQCFIVQQAHAGKKTKYKVSDIPKELLKGAESVIRNSELKFERKSISDAVLSVHEVITILNKSALDDATLMQYYDKFSKVRKARIIVYDEYGIEVKKLGLDDIKDISAIDGGTLFSDARVKLIDAEYQTIPFTVEISYEIDYSGTLSTPKWSYYQGYNIAIEKSSFTIITSEANQLRYYSLNTNQEPTKLIDDGKVILKWEVSNLSAIKGESFSSSFYETTPVILSAPSYFSIGGTHGNASSWELFGRWISELNQGRDELPEETVAELKLLLVDSISKIETINLLYNWMQDKTRYVSIQIGIGGWQPIEAADVDKYSYGDCKALTNYMHSVLNVANIESYYTLVRAGSDARNIVTDFPSNQFNHAILCVPVDNDTVWLECTSQTNPFGYLGTFTDDRDVLLITDNGGKVVHTKSYDKYDNVKLTKAVVQFDKYGDGEAHIEIMNKGLFYRKRLPVISMSEKRQEEYVINHIDIPSFELEDYSSVETKSMIPVIDEEIDLSIKSYVSKLGSRILFEVNLMNKIDYNFRRSGQRRNDIFLRRDEKEIDTIIYSVPNNYAIEAIPKELVLDTEFGSYTSKVTTDSESVIYMRSFELNKGKYSKEKYIEFKKFISDIRNADNQKVVLVSTN